MAVLWGKFTKSSIRQASILAYADTYHMLAAVLLVFRCGGIFMPSNLMPRKVDKHRGRCNLMAAHAVCFYTDNLICFCCLII